MLVALALSAFVAGGTPPEGVRAPSAASETRANAADAAERALDFDRARDLWLEALVEATTEEEQVRARTHLGVVYRILGDDGEARRHFEWLLARDPGFRLPADAPQRAVVFLELLRSEQPRPHPSDTSMTSSSSPLPRASSTATAPAGGLVVTAGSLGIAAVGAAVGSGVLFALASAADDEASTIGVQLDRAAAYDRRDAWATGAVVAAAASGVLVLGAAGAGLGALVTEP